MAHDCNPNAILDRRIMCATVDVPTAIVEVPGLDGAKGDKGDKGDPGEPGGSFRTTFTDANLSVANFLVVNHGLGRSPHGVSITDNTGNKIIPDSWRNHDENTVIVELTNFRPLIGTWAIAIGA